MPLKLDSFLPDDEKALARLTWMIAQSYSDGKGLLIIVSRIGHVPWDESLYKVAIHFVKK